MMKKQRKRVKRFDLKIVRGLPLNYNASLQAKYVKVLRDLVRKMTNETKKEIINLFETSTARDFYEEKAQMAVMDASIASQAKLLTNQLLKKFDQLFGKVAEPEAKKMVDATLKTSTSVLGTSLKTISENYKLKNNLMNGPLREIVKASIAENVALIKSIASEYLGKVQGSVMRSITTGHGLKTLIPAIEKYDGISERKARFIALDQTRKVFNNVNANRMQAVGIKKFEWVHSGGGHTPRQDHIEMSGNIYSYDDLPIIDQKTGERGITGQLPGCRCISRPIYEYSEEENE